MFKMRPPSFKHSLHKLFICALLGLLSTNAFAEVSLLVKTPVELRSSVAVNSPAVGMLHCGAKVNVLDVLPKGWYKVRVDNGSEGYVSALNLTVDLNQSDCINSVHTPSKPIGDQYYGSPTLFILGASVKVRAAPNPSAKTVNIYHTGDAVKIAFDPRNEGEWASINGSSFILRKYLGAPPQLADLISRFDQLPASDLVGRRSLAERAVELAWNTEGTSAVPALERFLLVTNDLVDPQLTHETELALLLARGKTKNLSEKALNAIMRSAKTYAVVAGKKEHDAAFTFPVINKLLGKPSKVINLGKDGNQCGGAADYAYEYPAGIIELYASDKGIRLRELNLQFPSNAFVLNGFEINATTSEEEFLKHFGHLISSGGFEMHHYQIRFWEEADTFDFENGLPKRVRYWYDDC